MLRVAFIRLVWYLSELTIRVSGGKQNRQKRTFQEIKTLCINFISCYDCVDKHSVVSELEALVISLLSFHCHRTDKRAKKLRGRVSLKKKDLSLTQNVHGSRDRYRDPGIAGSHATF